MPTIQPLAITVLTQHGEHDIPFQSGENLRNILARGNLPVRSACGGNAVCGLCVVRVEPSAGMAPTAGELNRFSPAQLCAGLRLACQVVPTGNLRVTLEAPLSPATWRPLREDEYSPVPLPLPMRVTDVRYGVAVDLGTTHIRISLWDLQTRERIDGRSGLNPQSIYGADVLTRLMEAARSRELALEIGGLAQQAIGQALADMAADAHIHLEDIGDICLVGNTAMLALLAGKNHALLLQPEYWSRRIDCQPQDIGFLREAWGVSGAAAIRFIPPLGGFIGSDLLAGMVATRINQQPPGTLLIDFGTNSEIALWDGHVLHVTSAAGGPAFEGSGISCGMPGEAGAIYRVKTGKDRTFELDVLGGGKPQGVCGSGLVDSVAWLRQNARLDKVGRFSAAGDTGFMLYQNDRSIVLQSRDIDVFQRAKGAIGAGVLWLCRAAGMPLSGLRRVHACGAFGRLLDVANAQSIGLLPPVPIEAVELQGNTALAGCETLLLSSTATEIQDALLAQSHVYNMAESDSYERLFVENLYLQPMQD